MFHKRLNHIFIYQKEQSEKTVTYIFFQLPLRDVENNCRDMAENDMGYDEFKGFCGGSWKEEEYKSYYIDRYKKKSEGKSCFCDRNRPETHTIEP